MHENFLPYVLSGYHHPFHQFRTISFVVETIPLMKSSSCSCQFVLPVCHNQPNYNSVFFFPSEEERDENDDISTRVDSQNATPTSLPTTKHQKQVVLVLNSLYISTHSENQICTHGAREISKVSSKHLIRSCQT